MNLQIHLKQTYLGKRASILHSFATISFLVSILCIRVEILLMGISDIHTSHLNAAGSFCMLEAYLVIKVLLMKQTSFLFIFVLIAILEVQTMKTNNTYCNNVKIKLFN